MRKKVEIARFLNRILGLFGFCICYRRDVGKFFLIKKSCKKYKGDWSIGCYISLPKCASSSIATTLGQINTHPQHKINPTPRSPWVHRTEAPPFNLEGIKSESHLNEFEKSTFSFKVNIPPSMDEKVVPFFNIGI